MSPELKQLGAWLELVAPEQADFYWEAVGTLSDRQERRLAKRDAAIREALAIILERGAQSAANAAAELARRWMQYVSGAAWKGERQLDLLPKTTDPLRVLLHRISKLNKGRALSMKQVAKIGSGDRAGRRRGL